MKQIRFLVLVITFLFGSYYSFSQTPQSFLRHKVKKGETLELIINKYNITDAQLKEYNPSLERFGLRKRMNLRIPIYPKQIENKPLVEQKKVENTLQFIIHDVLPKETKWRLAYQYNTTVELLDSLNPEIREGLKIGQKIKIPQTEPQIAIPEKDSLYNYYKVLPKEGFYRIEKKLGVTKAILDSLNPELEHTGLIAGMILKIPGEKSGELMIKNDLLVERVDLENSPFQKKKIKLAVLLPFKVNEIEFDSVEDTKRLLQTRNLHTLSLDFYSGVLYAVEYAKEIGISIELTTYDTENNLAKLDQIAKTLSRDQVDFIVGPLIPTNFDHFSKNTNLVDIPKIAPLSSNPVVLRKNVVQSIPRPETFRNAMYAYLERVIDTTHHVVLVADSLNRSIERKLKTQFPWAITLRPEKGDYILPELADSLLIDSLPNKVILETQSFPLIANALSQFNAQISKERKVQVFTTFRSNVYENENLSPKMLGGIQFTYPVGYKPLSYSKNENFITHFEDRFGKPPNKESLRGHDLVLDLILRIAVSNDLKSSTEVGETQYRSNRFLYNSQENGSFINEALFLLQHQGYEVIEIKE